LVNVVTGVPDEIGDALTTHPDIGKIGFTGSIRAARRIGANAAQTIKSVTFELGGNDPAILLDDADLSDATMNRIVANAFFMAGQYCMAIKRIFVPESLADAFHDALRRSVDKIVVGDGLVPGVTMGPLHSQAQLARATGFVDDARARGADVETLGTIADEAVFARGYFMQPTIVTNIAADAPLVADEQFCPSVPILTYRDVEEALASANDTIYGLGGSVWSRDLDRAARVASRIAAGMVSINAHGGPVSRHVARGGIKQSGVGRKLGLEGILDYLQTQTITTPAGA
jgi:acyl-CoA reductase-like NAD-dependent aldehyde dehydrogenase